MSNPTAPCSLGVSALEAAKQQFRAVFTRPLLEQFVTFSLDTAASQLVIAARTESDSGEASSYRGSYRWTYVKVNLATVLPHPLALETPYPMSFRQLRAQLQARFGVHLEEGEFALTAGGTGLQDDDNVNAELGSSYAQLRLYALPSSGRFVAGSSFGLIFVQPQRRVPLTAVLDLNAPGVLSPLAAQ